MTILRKKEYLLALKVIILFILKDSKNRVFEFKNKLDEQVNNLVNFPYKFVQSKNHDDEHVRDMTFKGYTITYFIEEEKDRISILDVYKWIDK